MASPGVGLLLLLLLSLFVPPSLSSLYRVSRAVERQREFDYFVLALQWPGTLCQRTRYCCHSNGCCRGSLPSGQFTIHGLWVNYDDGSWPACCSKSYFDLKKITSLIGKLESGKVPNDAGFVANYSEKYRLADIIAAVKSSTGAAPLLVCSYGAIQELHLCFYKDLEPRDCGFGSNTLDGLLNSRRFCPRYVSLPEHTPFVPRGGTSTVARFPDSGDSESVAQE